MHKKIVSTCSTNNKTIKMLHDILDDDQIQWHPTLIGHYTNFWPLLIWTLLPNLTFYLIVQGFHGTYATGAACQQGTLTPPDTWSCPTLGLACVLMSRLISPELVLSPDFWISNIPRYFSFALYWICIQYIVKKFPDALFLVTPYVRRGAQDSVGSCLIFHDGALYTHRQKLSNTTFFRRHCFWCCRTKYLGNWNQIFLILL